MVLCLEAKEVKRQMESLGSAARINLHTCYKGNLWAATAAWLLRERRKSSCLDIQASAILSLDR